MARKQPEEWITSQEAAAILSKLNGHTISTAYVRRLGLLGKFTTKAIDGRTKFYLKGEVEATTITAKPGAGRKKKQKASS